MHLSIWREKTRAAAKYLLSLMTCTERDKDIKYMMGLIRNTNLNTDLAMLTHHLNELIAKDDMARDAADKASYEPQDQKATHRLRNYLD